MSASKRALNVIRLTHHYPCDSKDLYYLASVFFDRTRVTLETFSLSSFVSLGSALPTVGTPLCPYGVPYRRVFHPLLGYL